MESVYCFVFCESFFEKITQIRGQCFHTSMVDIYNPLDEIVIASLSFAPRQAYCIDRLEVHSQRLDR